MLIQTFEQNALLFNSNLTERCTSEPLEAYRGELIVIEGEVADASGRRRPPVKVLQQAAVLAGESSLRFLSGFLDNAADLGAVLERYSAWLQPDSLAVIFVFDIPKAAVVKAGELTVHLVPLSEGLAWTELMELAALEKGDIKNLSSADKVFAVYRELLGFRPRGAVEVDLAAALTLGNGKQRETRGAV